MINIGVTQRHVVLNSNDIYDALEITLSSYFIQINISIVPIPSYFGSSNNDIEFDSWLENHEIKGFLLSGGGDPFKVDTRYCLEDKVLSKAKLERFPVFSICRGLERIVIHEGGQLINCLNHINKTIDLSGDINGSVKCFHNLTISKLPDQFRITSFSNDNLIESVAHKNLPWEGCMWHPERSVTRNMDLDARLIKLFHG